MLGNEYIIQENESRTKEKILVESARLFAVHGFSTVSVRDIAKEVGLKPGSLYNHFESKEALLDSIFDRFDVLYNEYLRRVRLANREAGSIEEVLENAFHELRYVTNIFNFYGIALVIKEQFNIPRARDIYLNNFFGVSLEVVEDGLQGVINKGPAKPFDIESMAVLINSTVITGCCMTIHGQPGHSLPHTDLDQGYAGFIRLLSQVQKLSG